MLLFFAATFLMDVAGWQLTLLTVPLDLRWLGRLYLVRTAGEAINNVTPFGSMGGQYLGPPRRQCLPVWIERLEGAVLPGAMGDRDHDPVEEVLEGAGRTVRRLHRYGAGPQAFACYLALNYAQRLHGTTGNGHRFHPKTGGTRRTCN